MSTLGASLVTLGNITNNFDTKTWLGIGGIILMCIIFFKGMGTKEGGAGGSGNGNGNNNGSTNSNVSNTTSNTNNNVNNNNGVS